MTRDDDGGTTWLGWGQGVGEAVTVCYETRVGACLVMPACHDCLYDTCNFMGARERGLFTLRVGYC